MKLISFTPSSKAQYKHFIIHHGETLWSLLFQKLFFALQTKESSKLLLGSMQLSTLHLLGQSVRTTFCLNFKEVTFALLAIALSFDMDYTPTGGPLVLSSFLTNLFSYHHRARGDRNSFPNWTYNLMHRYYMLREEYSSLADLSVLPFPGSFICSYTSRLYYLNDTQTGTSVLYLTSCRHCHIFEAILFLTFYENEIYCLGNLPSYFPLSHRSFNFLDHLKANNLNFFKNIYFKLFLGFRGHSLIDLPYLTFLVPSLPLI